MRKLLASLFAGGLLLAVGLGIYAQAQSPGVNSNLAQVWDIPLDSIKRTYAVGIDGFVVASSPTTYWQLCGSATSTVRVTQVTIAGRQTTAAHADFQILKTSTAATGGTITALAPFSSAAIVGIPYDTGFAAGTAKVTAWSANPTIGTSLGAVWSGQLFLGNLTTTQSNSGAVVTFGNRPGSALVLRGTAQCMAIDSTATNTGTVGPGSGNLMDITTEWTEE